jgi:hypothetical protein
MADYKEQWTTGVSLETTFRWLTTVWTTVIWFLVDYIQTVCGAQCALSDEDKVSLWTIPLTSNSENYNACSFVLSVCGHCQCLLACKWKIPKPFKKLNQTYELVCVHVSCSYVLIAYLFKSMHWAADTTGKCLKNVFIMDNTYFQILVCPSLKIVYCNLRIWSNVDE